MTEYQLKDVLAKVKRPGKIQKSDYKPDGLFPIIDQGEGQIAGYTDNADIVLNTPLPMTIFGDHTRRVKFSNEPFVCGADGTQLLYPNRPDIDPHFFYYAVKNIDLSNYFYARHFKFLKDQYIQVPNEGTQKQVVSILSKYDELIENNRKRILLLEEAARQLYKEWFVRLRFPGCEHVAITDGVPEGWEAHKLGDLLAKVKRPGKIKKEDYLESGPIPCVDQSQDFVGGYTDSEDAVITSPLPLVVFGDHTRVLKFIDFPFACGADGTQLLFPNDARLTVQYFYFAVESIDLSNYFYARHFKFLKDQTVLIPTENLVREFTEFTKQSLKQISTLREANHRLGRARDLLLPKLMSGEIAV